jgi:hypothetical protein
MNLSIVDRIMLMAAQSNRFQACLPIEGVVAGYSISGQGIEIHVQKPGDIDRLRSMEAVVLQAARLIAGVEYLSLWFCGELVCVLERSELAQSIE